MPKKEQKINLDIKAKSKCYPIYIGPEIISQLPEYIENQYSGIRLVIITDSNVKKLYGKKIENILAAGGYSTDFLYIQPGEESKSLDWANKLYEHLSLLQVDRHDCLVALGGGVVGDLVGFVASTFLRGLPFIQIPTTLLAQIDSSIGGKVGVDLPWGKNLVGSFYQPILVVEDLELLKSLPDKEFTNGLAEVIKTGLLSGGNLYQIMISNKQKILKRETEILTKIVTACCKFKARIVEEDEKDTGKRAILNLGHTLGHAFEASGSYKIFNHGQSVAIGMLFSLFISQKMKLLKNSFYNEATEMIFKYNILPGNKKIKVTKIKELVAFDKKRKKEGINLILMAGPGQPEIKFIEMIELHNFIDDFFNEVLPEIG